MPRLLSLLIVLALVAPISRAQVLLNNEDLLPEWRTSVQPGVYATHAYNFDFEEGAWGARGFSPPLFDHPVRIAGGIDYFPENEFSSLTVLGADLTYSLPMDLLGRGEAHGGFGPRYYRSSFDNGSTSSSNDEFGFGLLVGATLPVGPVSIYGDIGTDHVFDEWNCYTRVGLGLTFGGEPE